MRFGRGFLWGWSDMIGISGARLAPARLLAGHQNSAKDAKNGAERQRFRAEAKERGVRMDTTPLKVL